MPLDQGKIWSNNNAFAAHPDRLVKPLDQYPTKNNFRGYYESYFKRQELET